MQATARPSTFIFADDEALGGGVVDSKCVHSESAGCSHTVTAWKSARVVSCAGLVPRNKAAKRVRNLSIRILSCCLGAVLASGLLLFSQQPPPKTSPGTQNAPPPPGGAENNRAPAPAKRKVAGGDGYPDYDAASVERGQKIFQANCQFCHGANGKGGEGGPNLLRSVLVIHDESGNQIGPVIHNGRPDKGMPKFPLTDEQIADISTFLHQRIKDAALRGTYQILNIVTGDPKKGEAYFNGHCSGCHSVTGDLAHIGSKVEPVDLQQKIVMPREGGRNGHPSPKQQITATVTLPSGEKVEGPVAQIDDFTISLRLGDDGYRSFTRDGDVPNVELHDPLKPHTDMLSKYTDADIHNLTAYLVTLK
jgi:cytochrome c oxidase cbb3-type subunit III